MSTTSLAQAPPEPGGISDVVAAVSGVVGADVKPFVGLVPLEEEDAKLLAGRDEEVRILTTNLRASRLTLVYGASGAGKSSLLRAGVIANLRLLAQENLENCGSPLFAVAIINNWAGDVFGQLAESVREAIRRALDVQTLPPLPIAKDKDLVETLRTWTSSFGLELLIILDQFEEMFLYDTGVFASELPRAINATDLRVRFLLSLRDDSLYKLDGFQTSLPSLFENRLQVFPLTVENAKQAIGNAIAAYNETQPKSDQVQIEKELVDTVLEQVRTTNVGRDGVAQAAGPVLPVAGARYIDAPYMQLVMARLWDEESAGWQKSKPAIRVLRLATLTRLGSAQAVVQQHLDRVMQNFSSAERRLAADCFYRLVTPGGSKYALTPLELEKWAHHPADDVENFLEKLVDSQFRILRRVDKKGLDGVIATGYEAHHDRIAHAMLSWQLRYREAKRTRRTRLILALSFLLIVGLALAAAWKQKRDAAIERAVLEAQQLLVLQQKDLEVLTTEQTAKSAEETDRGKISELRNLVPQFTCKAPNANLDVAKINKLLQIDCTQLAQTTAAPNAPLSPRIYIQIQTEDQRDAAKYLKQLLSDERYNGRKAALPGIENVGPRPLRTSQLRYFHKDDPEEVNYAWLIVTSLKKLCVDVGKPVFLAGYEDSTAIRKSHFELWLTPDALYNLGCNNSSTAK